MPRPGAPAPRSLCAQKTGAEGEGRVGECKGARTGRPREEGASNFPRVIAVFSRAPGAAISQPSGSGESSEGGVY